MLDKPGRVTFSEPRRDGSFALERCIRQRRSVRSFRDQALTEDQLGQMLWAAQGVTGPDAKRAVPSAGALYPLELYVLCRKVTPLAAGVYRYLSERHELRRVALDYQHEKLVDATYSQEWVATAPAVICIAAVFARTTVKYGNRGRGYVFMEAGHAAENLMLQAVALDLAATMVGAFSDEKIERLLYLEADETPLCLLPVGVP
jgi:SagB-type dehydrogenase family enzyme